MERGLIHTSSPGAASFTTADDGGQVRRTWQRGRSRGRHLASSVVLGLIFLLPVVAQAQWTLDDGFDPREGPSETVHAVAVQTDGKVLVGGQFTQVSGQPRIGVARFNPDGSLDTMFRADTNGTVFSLKLQADGRILVGGGYSEIAGRARKGLARLNPDGSLDDTFNPAQNGGVFSIVEQPDGKLLVGGFFWRPDGEPGPHIARLNPDGSLDTSFNAGWGASSYVFSIALQSDGKILAGGNFISFDGQPRSYVARLNADGSLDTSFNSGANAAVRAVVAQPDGRILLGGSFTTVNNQPCGYLARLNSDGTLDGVFSGETNGDIHVITAQPDGKFIIGGDFLQADAESGSRIARLNPDGSLDTSFRSKADGIVKAVAVRADGRVVAGGGFTQIGGLARNHVAGLNADGTGDGVYSPGVDAYVHAVVTQADGSTLLGGDFLTVGGNSHEHLARLNADGSPDESFGPEVNGTVNSVAVQMDEKILIGGAFDQVEGRQQPFLTRLNADGSLDESFSDNGPDGEVYCIALQPDGRILIGGLFTKVAGQSREHIARLNPDGSLDASFNPAGVFDWANYVASIALQADGRVVIGGYFFYRNGGAEIGRLNADGSLDTSFNCFAGNVVMSVKVQPDGKILIGGDFQQIGRNLARSPSRLNPDGSLDLTFYNTGSETNDMVETIVTQTNGKIWVGGRFSSVDAGRCSRIIKLRPDGSLEFCPLGNDGQVEAITFRPDNRVLVGGYFTTLLGQPRESMGRLANSDGGSEYLTVNLYGTAVTWLRSGGSPEVDHVVFELSTDGSHYIPLGAGRRVRGGWQLSGLTLPQRRGIFVRARGAYSTGRNNGSVAVVQSVRSLFLPGGLSPSPSSQAEPSPDSDTQ